MQYSNNIINVILRNEQNKKTYNNIFWENRIQFKFNKINFSFLRLVISLILIFNKIYNNNDKTDWDIFLFLLKHLLYEYTTSYSTKVWVIQSKKHNKDIIRFFIINYSTFYIFLFRGFFIIITFSYFHRDRTIINY